MFAEWKGIFPYLVSPVDENGRVKERVLRNLVEYLIRCGVHGLTPLGSTGEFFYLNWEQKKEIVRIVVDAAAHRVPVVAGVSAASNREAVWQAKEMEKLGVDGILAILNIYFPLKQDQIFEYFADIAKEVSCQVVIYNNPRFTGFEIEISTLKKLSELPNVNYYKDASGNTGRLLQISNAVGSEMRIFSASAHVPVFVMMLGGVGWMAGPACLLPKESVKIYELCEKNMWDEAFLLQRKMWEINRVFQKYNLAACVKAGLEILGFDVGNPILPNRPLKSEEKDEIRQVITMIKKEFGRGERDGNLSESNGGNPRIQ